MFCKKCGCRIPASALHCPECGAERPETEFCAGFWADLNQCSGQNKMETIATDAGEKHSANTQSVNTADMHDEEDRKPKTAGPQKDVSAADSEPAGPQKAVLSDVPGKPEHRGHLLQIIEAVIILVLLVTTVILGNALKTKANRIEILEQKLEKAEAIHQSADKKSGTAAQSGQDAETGTDKSETAEAWTDKSEAAEAGTDKSEAAEAGTYKSEAANASPMTASTGGRSQVVDDQNPRPGSGIGLKESENSDSASSAVTGTKALKHAPRFQEEHPEPYYSN